MLRAPEGSSSPGWNGGGISGVVKEYTYLGLNTLFRGETDDGQKTVEIVEESSIEDELKLGQRVLLR